jgi:DNA-binding CsgD family transcriptional regulator
MLQPRYLSVWQAQSEDEYRREVIEFGWKLGFDTISAACVVDHSLTSTQFFGVDNTPAAYREMYEDSSSWKKCPVMQHCKYSPIPIIWDQQTYLESGQIRLWEEQAAHGYKNGVALALHFPGDRHYFIGVDRDKPLIERSKQLTKIVADLQFFAVYAQEAGFKLFYPDVLDGERQTRLTPRELEALRWTMDGRTAWEVGEVLNISERTAVFHLQNAVNKLDCTSKYQAVLKAMRLGLLR